MKEMIYKLKLETECLDKGTYNGIDYIIASYGTHPCAYIRIPETSKFYKVDRDDVPEELDSVVHGCITWSGPIPPRLNADGFYYGWDYCHAGDFTGTDLMFPPDLRTGGKKWTTEEILDEVKAAIDILNVLEEDKYHD